jgi:hypothetical protein
MTNPLYLLARRSSLSLASVTRIFLNSQKSSRDDTHFRREGGLPGSTLDLAPDAKKLRARRSCYCYITVGQRVISGFEWCRGARR